MDDGFFYTHNGNPIVQTKYFLILVKLFIKIRKYLIWTLGNETMKRLLGLLNRSRLRMGKTSRRGVHLCFEGDPRFLWSRIDPQEFCPIMITGKLTYICNHDQGTRPRKRGRFSKRFYYFFHNVLKSRWSHIEIWRIGLKSVHIFFRKNRRNYWFRCDTTVGDFLKSRHLKKKKI